jgi:ribosomal protein S18 acetylase RimI-like enzyme
MSDAELNWRAEETNLNAFPALSQEVHRGWLLRFSEGRPRRTNNSASPLRADCAAIDNVINAIASLYRQNGLPTLFRVPSFMPPSYDRELAAHGYTSEGDSCVLYGGINEIDAAADPAVELLPRPTTEWLTAMGELQGYGRDQRATYHRVLNSVPAPVAFAGLRVDGRLAALAYGVVHSGLLCYESVITDLHCRRRGLACRVIASLAAWAREQGARGACLQVEASNTPALNLYDQFGLKTELYRYHYRRAPG